MLAQQCYIGKPNWLFNYCNSELAAAKDRIATDQKAITELEGKKNSIVKGMQDEILALKLKCLKEEGTEQAA